VFMPNGGAGPDRDVPLTSVAWWTRLRAVSETPLTSLEQTRLAVQTRRQHDLRQSPM